MRARQEPHPPQSTLAFRWLCHMARNTHSRSEPTHCSSGSLPTAALELGPLEFADNLPRPIKEQRCKWAQRPIFHGDASNR